MSAHQILVEPILFVLAVLALFYLPGTFLTKRLKLKLPFLDQMFFRTILGVAVFLLITYVASWLGSWMITIPVLLAIDALVLKDLIKHRVKVKPYEWKVLAFVGVMALLFCIPTITSGEFGDRIRLIGVNASDGLWHIQLINEMRVHFPPDNPGFSGVPLKGYHFFYNFLLAKVSNFTTLSPFALLFRYFPILTAFLWGLGVYTIMHLWTKKDSVSAWAVFLTFFGGSFAFLLPLQGHNGLSLETGLGINQGFSSLVNPPFAFSIVMLLGALYALFMYQKEKRNGWLVPLALIAGLITMIKVYAGMIILGTLGVLTIIALFRKQIAFIVMFGITGLLVLCTYWIFSDSSSKLIFHPLWAPRKVLEDNFTWYGYTEKLYTYTKLNVTRKLIEMELYGLYVFVFGNLGTRLFGLLIVGFMVIKNKLKLSPFAQTIGIMTLISYGVPMLFLQSGKVYEIIQMAWYSMFFFSLIATIGFGYLFSLKISPIIKTITAVLIILITLPSSFEIAYRYNPFEAVKVKTQPDTVRDATNFLKSQGAYNDTVLELPQLQYRKSEKTIIDWYHETHPKVTAYVNKRGYVQFENHSFPGVDLDERLRFIGNIIRSKSDSNLNESLKSKGIVFVYSTTDLPILNKASGIKRIFQNESATIYKVE